MPKQVQIRRANNATQSVRTFVTGELDYDTTNKRLSLHDGLTAGGTPHLNAFDQAKDTYGYAAATGTNALTLDLALAPSALVSGLRVNFKAENTNTGAVTLNVNSLGATTVKKKNVFAGSLSAMDAGDIIQNGMYSAVYNGTDFIIESIDSGGIETVNQSDLNTSLGSVSAVNTPYVRLTLPGGLYGFYPQMRQTSLNAHTYCVFAGGVDTPLTDTSDKLRPEQNALTTGYISQISAGASTGNVDIQQRYITSSPPFDLGDGECAGFMFAMVDKAGNIKATYIADVPPWAYNGPTDIRGKYCSLRKKKMQRVAKKQTIEQILDGAPLEYELKEVTQEIKNADMGLIPHPFNAPDKDHTIVLIDPMDVRIANIIASQNAGDTAIEDAISEGKIKIDNSKLKRACPKGVTVHKIRI